MQFDQPNGDVKLDAKWKKNDFHFDCSISPFNHSLNFFFLFFLFFPTFFFFWSLLLETLYCRARRQIRRRINSRRWNTRINPTNYLWRGFSYFPFRGKWLNFFLFLFLFPIRTKVFLECENRFWSFFLFCLVFSFLFLNSLINASVLNVSKEMSAILILLPVGNNVWYLKARKSPILSDFLFRHQRRVNRKFQIIIA